MRPAALRRWTAYHEAGHAVVRIVRTGAATQIDIGELGVGYSHGSGDEIRVTDSIEISLAGPLAEARHRKVSLFSVYLTGGCHDWRAAKTAAAGHAALFAMAEMNAATAAIVAAEMNAHSILRNAESNARRILRCYWPSVERLAQAVLVRNFLTGMEVGQIAAID